MSPCPIYLHPITPITCLRPCPAPALVRPQALAARAVVQALVDVRVTLVAVQVVTLRALQYHGRCTAAGPKACQTYPRPWSQVLEARVAVERVRQLRLGGPARSRPRFKPC